MNNEWIEFNDDHQYVDTINPRVTLDMKRNFRLNAKALELMGRPTAVKFLFDAARNRVGIRGEDPAKAQSFKVVPSKSGSTAVIRAFPFCKRFGIKPEYAVAFQGVQMDADGILVLDLATVKRKSR